jgi:tellurite resistance protein
MSLMSLVAPYLKRGWNFKIDDDGPLVRIHVSKPEKGQTRNADAVVEKAKLIAIGGSYDDALSAVVTEIIWTLGGVVVEGGEPKVKA